MDASERDDRPVHLQFDRRPRAWAYMAGALLPSPGLPPGRPFPALSAAWRDHRPTPRDVADFARLAAGQGPADKLPALYPHAIGFRLQMALLTHPAFPVPIWRVLQVRNQLLQLRPIASQAVLDFRCRVHGHRVLEKGLEADLHTTVHSDGTLVAESLNTFYVRGRFGPPAAQSAPEAPAAGETVVGGWEMPAAQGWRFGALTGDYNGIHLWDPYARMLGFKRAFFHPLRALGHALSQAKLGHDSGPRQIDVWLKGPVYHGSQVRLRVNVAGDATVLALLAGEETRPAIVARVRQVAPHARLAQEAGRTGLTGPASA